jgi:hypothetical protein
MSSADEFLSSNNHQRPCPREGDNVLEGINKMSDQRQRGQQNSSTKIPSPMLSLVRVKPVVLFPSQTRLCDDVLMDVCGEMALDEAFRMMTVNKRMLRLASKNPAVVPLYAKQGIYDDLFKNIWQPELQKIKTAFCIRVWAQSQ